MTVKCASFYPYRYFPEITYHDRRYLHISYCKIKVKRYVAVTAKTRDEI
jgi:hypothetical protein